jgi:hypothetical protein
LIIKNFVRCGFDNNISAEEIYKNENLYITTRSNNSSKAKKKQFKFMTNIKTFEEHKITNLSDVMKSNNMSADYHINKNNGKFPYVKVNGEYVKIEDKQSIPRNVEYLSPDKVEKYNKIAKDIKKLQEEQNNIL